MTNNTKILLTGGTGLLGTGLLHYFDYKSFEGSIYLLIRDKKDKSALSRFDEIKRQFHNLKLFLVTVSLLDIDSFVLDVDCIINCAASIEFTLPLEDALKQNVDGLKNLIEFAKKNEVKKFIHVSTAYVSNCCEELIKEEFVDLSVIDADIDRLYEDIKNKILTFDKIVKKRFFPNTYCFTKCLAEKFVEKEINNNSKIAFSVIRPSIVTSAINVPYNGWFKGYTARIGLYSLVHLKYLKYTICNDYIKTDVVPVDYVCYLIYNSLHNKKIIPIKHAVSFMNTFSNFEIENMHNNVFDNNWFLKNKKNIVTFMYDLLDWIVNSFYVLLLSFLSFYSPKYGKLKNKLQNVYNISKNINNIFYHFVSNTYNFDSSNSSTEKKQFIAELPEYCNNSNKYELSMNYSIRNSLNIHDDLTKYSFFNTITNIWNKYYTCARVLHLCYLTFCALIAKFVLNKMYKNITIEFKDIKIIQRCFHSHKPIVILSNHQSHFDTIIMKYLFLAHPTLNISNPASIACDEFKSLPDILLKMLNLTNIKYISRDNFDKEEFKNYLNEEFSGNMLLFPEGSRTRDKCIHTFKSGIYNLLKKNIDFNVLPISISYSNVPEGKGFIDSLINGKNLKLFDKMKFLRFVFSLLNPFHKPKDSCHLVIDKLMYPPDKIEDVEKIIHYNHHSSLNKYFKKLNINNENDDIISYYFNNIQYAKYDTTVNNDDLTNFQKYIIDKDETNININKKVPIINKIDINYKKFFYPIYSDFISLHYKIDGRLLLGEYSKNLYNKMINNHAIIDEFVKDIQTIVNSKEKYILITGGSGLIGSNYLQYASSLNTLDAKYIVLSRTIKQNEIIKIGKCEFHMLKGDLVNMSSTEDYDFKLLNVKEIYHFAGYVTHYKNEKLIRNMNETNIEGTKSVARLVEFNNFLRKKDESKCKLIYLSTSGVIGAHTLHNESVKKLDETAEYSENAALFPYYKSKIDAEKLIISHSKKNNYELIVFRPSIIFGNNSTDILNKLKLSSSNKEDVFTKIKSGKLFFSTDSNINAVTVNELVHSIVRASNQKSKEKIRIYNFTGNNYKVEDVFKYYNKSYLHINKYFLRFLIYMTETINIPSLFYYMRMAQFEWELNSNKAKKELKFTPEKII